MCSSHVFNYDATMHNCGSTVCMLVYPHGVVSNRTFNFYQLLKSILQISQDAPQSHIGGYYTWIYHTLYDVYSSSPPWILCSCNSPLVCLIFPPFSSRLPYIPDILLSSAIGTSRLCYFSTCGDSSSALQSFPSSIIPVMALFDAPLLIERVLFIHFIHPVFK